jgi:hypothetical protein
MILTINHAGGLDAGFVSTRNGIVMHTTCVKARYRCSATHPHITPYALPSGGDAAYLPARARTEQKKRQRAAAIVEAALSLALETGVASVTLAARTRSPLYISAPDRKAR